MRAEAESGVLSESRVPIFGSDRDDGAVEAAQANAVRATVDGAIEFSVRPISAIEATAERGWLVSNPPYGVRVGERDPLRNLYAQLGKVVRAKIPGWHVALVTADAGLERQLGLGLRPVLKTTNGGIRVRVMAGDVRGGDQADSAVPISRRRRKSVRRAAPK